MHAQARMHAHSLLCHPRHSNPFSGDSIPTWSISSREVSPCLFIAELSSLFLSERPHSRGIQAYEYLAWVPSRDFTLSYDCSLTSSSEGDTNKSSGDRTSHSYLRHNTTRLIEVSLRETSKRLLCPKLPATATLTTNPHVVCVPYTRLWYFSQHFRLSVHTPLWNWLCFQP